MHGYYVLKSFRYNYKAKTTNFGSMAAIWNNLQSTVVSPWSILEHARTTSAHCHLPWSHHGPPRNTPGPPQHSGVPRCATAVHSRPRQDHARTTLLSAIIRGAIAVHQGTREDRAAHTACLLPLSRSCRGSPKAARGPPPASIFVPLAVI